MPPLVSQAAHSLPAERDAFVGRNDALADLAKRFSRDARLVSVLGIGGTGKTRLVIRFGWSALDAFPGGIWFCDLSEARTLDGILRAVAEGLGVPLGSDDPVTRIGNAIAGRRQCLVILDNFEQVARLAEETLSQWLNRASFARFLVTTREVLGLTGEEILALGPMPPQDASTLFVKRAEAAKPGFALSTEDQAAIGPLAKLLDGLPLAIELAAARVRVMPPRTLLARMSDRFKLLSSIGGRLDRQATLRTVFDWSWDLLSLPEKTALAQLSVFEAGFTLEAAEAVLDLRNSDDAPWAIDVLQSLVQSVLALRGPFRIGIELSSLVQSIPGLEPGTAAVAHEVAGSALRLLGKAADARTALERSLEEAREAGDRACEIRALLDLGALDIHGGHAQSAHRVLQLALAAAGEMSDCALESEARNKLGNLQISLGNRDGALPHFEAALDLARKARDRRREVMALGNLGTMEVSGASKARFHCEAALAMARSEGDRMIEGNALCNLGLLNYLDGRLEEAREHLDMGLVVVREIGNVEAEGILLCNLGMVHDALARLDEAESHYDAALAIAREFELRRLEGQTLGYAGVLSARRGAFDEARSRLDAGEALLRAVSDRASLGILLCNRCEAEDLAGSSSAASAALVRAEEIAAEVTAGADSELGFALARLRRERRISPRPTRI